LSDIAPPIQCGSTVFLVKSKGMAALSNEALLQRAKQWKVFHDWERCRPEAPLTLDERIDWYLSAFEFARGLPTIISKDMAEKADRIRQLHTRLKDLRRNKSDV